MSVELFKAWVAERINDKSFSGYWDHVSNGTFGKKGRETWIDGKTGIAQISASTQGSGFDQVYIAKITIPVHSTYKRKTFIGVGSEYRSEGWDTTYNYHVTYRRGLTVNRFEGESFTDHSTGAGHDAVEWSQQELKEDVFKRLVS